MRNTCLTVSKYQVILTKQFLKLDPLAGDFYGGGLMTSLLSIDLTFWFVNEAPLQDILAIVDQHAATLSPEIHDDIANFKSKLARG